MQKTQLVKKKDVSIILVLEWIYFTLDNDSNTFIPLRFENFNGYEQKGSIIWTIKIIQSASGFSKWITLQIDFKT